MSDEHLTLPGDEPDPPAPEGEAVVVPPVAEEVVVPACTECGAPIDPDQQYCLQCGAPTPTAVPLRRRGATGPVIAAALLALGVGGGALIYALTKEDKGTTAVVSGPTTLSTQSTLPPFTNSTPTGTLPPFGSTTDTTDPFGSTTDTTDPFGSTTDTTDPFGSTTDTTDPFGSTTDTTDPFGSTTDTTDPFGTTTDSTTTGTTTTGATTTGTTTTTTTTTDTTPSGTDDWTGGDAYTVILSSVRNRAAADSFRTRVQNTGRSAGVLVSDNYTSLQTGYYAVFSGTYSTAAAAKRSAATLRAKYPGAYAAHIAA